MQTPILQASFEINEPGSSPVTYVVTEGLEPFFVANVTSYSVIFICPQIY